MKIREILVLPFLFLALAATGFSEAEPCGNSGDITEEPECGESAGTNLFNPFSGNVWRQITDLDVPASVGEKPLAFSRLSTSRYHGGLSIPFGASGNWRHNYVWGIQYNGLNANGDEIIEVHYPDGATWVFSKETPSSQYMTAVSRTHDRVEKVASNPDRYYLWHLDGSRLEFVKETVNGEIRFEPVGEYDRHNGFYDYTVDAENRVTRVTDPAGHYIQINFGPVGNFTTAFVEFSYTDAAASSVSVAGDFNSWDTASHPMVKTGDTWSVTIPIQAGSTSAGATYQYKFVVDGSTWISDPRNPETLPAGGPSTGNNSVLTVEHVGDDLDYAEEVPALFELTAPGAQTVSVAGSFNGWSTTSHVLVKDGDTWSTIVDLGQGDHYYKFVVDGNWQVDPANPFTAPDGLGGENSHLVVGPREEAITDVHSSDGRSVFYDYAIYGGTATLYTALEAVNYPDGQQADYSYATGYLTGARPRLETADDPRYSGKAGARMAYEYRDGGVEGFVTKEKNLVTGEVIVELQATGETGRKLISGAKEELLAYNTVRMTSRAYSGEPTPTRAYYDNNFGMLKSVTDELGNTTTYERTYQFGAVRKTIFEDGSYTERTFADPDKPFHLATERDELGRITAFTRDADGRPTRIDHPDGSYETFTYNAYGQILTHRLRNGGTESYAYDTAGLKTSHTDAEGNTTTYTYHSDGRLASVTDALARTSSYEYNARGQHTKVTYADGTFKTWTYDDYGNVLSETEETGDVTMFAYDEYGRKTHEIDPLGNVTEYFYPGGPNGCSACGFSSNPEQIISPDGDIVHFTYDNEGRRLTETRGYGTSIAATTSFGYDVKGRMISRTDPLGNTWSYTYDSRGRRLTETDPLGKVTSWTYDAVGNRLTETLPGLATWTMTYDAMNRILSRIDPLSHTSSFAYDSGGRLISQTDPLNRTTQYAYDLLNRRVQTTYPDSSTTSQSYDALGNLLTQTDELGRVTSYVYDNRNRLVVIANNLGEQFDYAYDAAGRRTAEMLPGGLTRHSDYDAAGRTVQVTVADGTTEEQVRTFTYSAGGELLTETDPLGNVTSHAYDALGRRSSITTPLGLVTQFAYDLNGNLLTQTRPDGSELTKAYDALGRVLSETDAAGDMIAYSYTPRGQLASITDSRSAVTQFGYDKMDRRTTKTYHDGAVEQSSYDAAGQMTRFTTARGVYRDYAYDNRGRLAAVTYSDSTPDVSYTYNAAGERLSTSNANATITQAYDAVGRPIGETHNLAGHPLGNRSFTLEHDVDSRLTKIAYPGSGGPQISYGYDLRGNLASVATSAFSIAYQRRLDDRIDGMSFSNGVDNERTYDADGRLTDTLYRRGSSAPFSRAAYSLNSLGQRTSVERADGYGDTFGYDAKDQLTGIGYEVQAPASGGTALHAGSFAYDAMGNRTSADTGFDPVTTYAANNLNQYTSVSAFSAAPTYDADGNMTSVDGLDLTWDAENRLIQIEPVLAVNGDHRVQYAYDPLGRRVRKTVDVLQGGYWAEESDAHYTYWEWNVIEEHRDFPVAPSETRRLVWGEDLSGSFQGAGGVGGLLVQTVSGGSHNGADWFYHYDGNGNVTELTDGSGATVATYRYTAFGDSWSQSGSAADANHYRFSTKPLDGETVDANSEAFSEGLYYYGFRYYDPVTGRWPSRDPIEELGGLNLYAMVENVSVNSIDFLGAATVNVSIESISFVDIISGLNDAGGLTDLASLEITYNCVCPNEEWVFDSLDVEVKLLVEVLSLNGFLDRGGSFSGYGVFSAFVLNAELNDHVGDFEQWASTGGLADANSRESLKPSTGYESESACVSAVTSSSDQLMMEGSFNIAKLTSKQEHDLSGDHDANHLVK